MVGVAGLEPAASSSRTKHATKLRYTPVLRCIVYQMSLPTLAGGKRFLLNIPFVLYYSILIKSRKFLCYLTLLFQDGILLIHIYCKRNVFYDSKG